jgi:hypothetical protein
MSEYAKNTNTGRLIKRSTSLYRKLKKLNQVEELTDATDIPSKPVAEAIKSKPQKPHIVQTEPDEPDEPDEPEPFDESKLQSKLADISTDMIKKNMKKIVKAQKLSDKELDIMLKKLLYNKLCIDEPKPKKKKKKRVVESSSEESESD